MKFACATTRIAFKNVLVAIDFSPISDSAWHFATAIAQRYGSKLWMSNVISPAETALVPPEYWGSSQQMIEETATRQLQELGSKLQDTPHEVLLEHGGIAETISAEVERLSIELLVLGTHGREGFDRLLMGSVAEEVFRRALCPASGVASKPASWGHFKTGQRGARNFRCCTRSFALQSSLI